MKTQELVKVIDQYIGLLSNSNYFDAKKTARLVSEGQLLKTTYSTMTIDEDLKHIYEALCKKGETVVADIKKNKQDQKGNLLRAKTFLRYMHAAHADFLGESTKAVGIYFLLYMTSSILFLALSPQYFGFVLPAIMFVPIYLGVKGVKNRAFSGFMMSMSVIPMGLMTATYWIQYGLDAFMNFGEAVAKVSESVGISGGAAQALVIVPTLLSVVLAVSVAIQFYHGIKIRNYFV